MGFEHVLVERSGDFTTITMNRPQRRNALSHDHMRELIAAFTEVGESSALGIVLAGNGPVFSAGHDFADVAERGPVSGPRPAGDLHRADDADPAGAAAGGGPGARAGHRGGVPAGRQRRPRGGQRGRGFAAPGGKGGWFCHTPMVAIARNVGRKRAAELALSGRRHRRRAPRWTGAWSTGWSPAVQLDSAVRGPARARHPRVGGEQGHRQAGAVRADRPRPAEGLCLRDRGDGRHQPAPRRPRGDARVPGEAQAAVAAAVLSPGRPGGHIAYPAAAGAAGHGRARG